MLYRPRMLYLPDLGSCDNGQHSTVVVINCISQTAMKIFVILEYSIFFSFFVAPTKSWSMRISGSKLVL